MLSHTRLCRPNAVNSHQACVSKVHKYPSHASAMHTRRPHPSVVAGSNPSSTASASISIEVVSGKESAPAGNLTCESGDILRGALLSNKVSGQRQERPGTQRGLSYVWLAAIIHSCLAAAQSRAQEEGCTEMLPCPSRCLCDCCSTGGPVHDLGEGVAVRRRWAMRHVHRGGEPRRLRPPITLLSYYVHEGCTCT